MKNSKQIAVKHSGQLGDILYSLPFIKALLSRYSFDQAVLYIAANKLAKRPNGLKHIGGDYMITASMYNFIYPLLCRQSYLRDIIFAEEEAIPNTAFDLDLIRNGAINTGAGNIRNYYFKYFGMFDSTSGPWIVSDHGPDRSPDIIVGRSTRYLNLSIDYSVLNEFGASIGFLGTNDEYQKFLELSPHSIASHILIDNALIAASLIRSCKLFVGNQSLFFAISEALDHTRLLESFEPVPNVVPSSGRSGSFLTTDALGKMASQVLGLNAPTVTQENSPSYILSL